MLIDISKCPAQQFIILKINTTEDDFNGMERPVIWCNRRDFPYDEIKRHAEYALWQKYADKNWLAVRYPVVLGKDDYTNRLKFYVDHVINQHPMYIDNLDCQMSYIKSDEAGRLMAYMVDKNVTCRSCEWSFRRYYFLAEILKYIEKRTKKRAILEDDGMLLHIMVITEFNINSDKAKSLGFISLRISTTGYMIYWTITFMRLNVIINLFSETDVFVFGNGM